MSSQTTLTFYGGLDEIGGNKILLGNKGTRIFLDFGKSFGARSRFYEWTDKPRLANGVGDFLALGILPDIVGIYRDDLLDLAGRKKKEDRFVDGVVLSHAHSDHADYISFLREDIPIWMGVTTKDIIESSEDERKASVEFEITKFKKRYPGEKKKKEDTLVTRKINTFTTSSKEFSIDSIRIEPIHVDHSVPGCYGFIITTSDRTIVYSGDLRLHGHRSDMTKEFVSKAAKAKPDVMLCEGTRVTEMISQTEQDVYQACLQVIQHASNHFVFADFSYKDIDRFITFYNIARKTNRKLLINAKTARYLRALTKRESSLKIPSVEDVNIAIFKPKEKSGRYEDSDYDPSDRALYKQTNTWTAKDVKDSESKVIMTLGAYSVDEMIDIKPSGGIYLHSASEPHNEEGEIDEERMKRWMEKFDLCRVHAHCSGHASGRDINTMLDVIQPKTLIPIHTEYPNLFKIMQGAKVVLAKKQATMEF